MQKFLNELWTAEEGAVISTELALVIAVMLLAAQSGVGVGLDNLSTSINGKLLEVGEAIQNIPVSYAYSGQSSCTAWVRGACFDGSERNRPCQTPLLVDDPCISQGSVVPKPTWFEGGASNRQRPEPKAMDR